MKKYLKLLLTLVVVLIAVGAMFFKYQDYFANPWTRDGQVRAKVIQIASRVSGPIVTLPIRNNQFVKSGGLLFEIDPRTFTASLDQARAQLDQTRANIKALEKQIEAAEAGVNASRYAVEQAKSTIAQLEATIVKNKADYERKQQLLPQKATSTRALQRSEANYEVSLQQKIAATAALNQARAALVQSQATLAQTQAQLGAKGEANPQLRAAVAAVEQAELQLEFTKVLAPVDGYVTNLNLRLGGQAAAGKAVVALVDVNSYWIDGYFKENRIANIRPGDRVVVTLMTYPDTPLEGSVDSLGWGISQNDGSTGFELLPRISATFEWIRLAQRVPVRVYLNAVPQDIALRVGTTCSVLVMAGKGDGDHYQSVPAAPKALQ